MKKTIILAVLALLGSSVLYAQERANDEERAKSMEERIERSANRLVGELGLNDDAKKKTFIEIYTAYQKEMFATNPMQARQFEQASRDGDKKQMSDEEATAKIKENFDRQEQQIATMQKRLEVQKKYADEFAKVLTPQQVLKVLNPQRGGGQRGGDQRRGGNDNRRGGNSEGGPRGGGFGGGGRGGFGGPGGF